MRINLVCILLFLYSLAGAQQTYKTGDVVTDIVIQKIINTNTAATKFSQLQKELTILDFFGTWCAPCVKALPLLAGLQQKNTTKVFVVLVSTEEQNQLENFIKKHQPFLFPLVIDNNNTFTNQFKPPSYPYTVVIGKNGKILSITDAASITQEKIDEWLQQQGTDKKDIVIPAPPVITVTNTENVTTPMKPVMPTKIIAESAPKNLFTELSRKFIYAAKTGNETSALALQLNNINFDSLANGLVTDNDKKAFWINLYNGFTQVLLKQNPEKFTSRASFYGTREIMIAGKKFSLDDIEHGILRRSAVKWSLGYLKKWFPSKTEKLLRVDTLDYRIHFTLNCGAKSCPPIASYDPAILDQQLDLATKAYLVSEAIYDREKNSVTLPTFMSWFRNDFKGRKKTIALLQQLSVVPADQNPGIHYKKYDWTLALGNYTDR